MSFAEGVGLFVDDERGCGVRTVEVRRRRARLRARDQWAASFLRERAFRLSELEMQHGGLARAIAALSAAGRLDLARVRVPAVWRARYMKYLRDLERQRTGECPLVDWSMLEGLAGLERRLVAERSSSLRLTRGLGAGRCSGRERRALRRAPRGTRAGPCDDPGPGCRGLSSGGRA